MADYLLDTNILSYWYDSRCAENAKIIAAVNSARRPQSYTGYVSRFFVSVVTLGEMEYGHRSAPTPDPKKQAEYAKFIHEQCPIALDMTSHVAEQYGQMKAWLFDTCSPKSLRNKATRYRQLVYPVNGEKLDIDENDLWIAAQAMTHDLVLVTHDRRGNFGKMLNQFAASLQVEDWAK